tara:strand:+ start:6370 stop:7029 length:660 start_codon:yes stop_codon:yes gene_type:complete
MELKYYGCLAYADALELQQKHWQAVKEGKSKAHIMALEHANVISLGRRAKMEEEVLATREQLYAKAVDVCASDRGGLATVHSPGQLVIYPILRLQDYGWGVRQLVCHLLKVSQSTLQDYNFTTSVLPDESGLQYGDKKMAFVGLRVQEGISRHGLAINLSNDLSLFDLIRSCGLRQRKHTSMKNEGYTVTVQDFLSSWQKNWEKSLQNCEINAHCEAGV